MDRKSKKYNAVVGTSGGGVAVLGEVFEYNNFRGATGYIMRPVYQDEIDEYNDIDWLMDYTRERWEMAVRAGDTDLGFREWCEMAVQDAQNEGLLYPWDDPSFRDEFDDAVENAPAGVREKIKALGEGCVAWSCDSCGRCLGRLGRLDEVWRTDLKKIIDKYEKC